MKEIIDACKAIIELVLPTVKDMELINQYGWQVWTYVLVIKLLAWVIVFYTLRSPIKSISKGFLKIGKRVVKYVYEKAKTRKKSRSTKTTRRKTRNRKKRLSSTA